MSRLALISEHASPLAVGGSTDSGGQNVYVGHVARQLARQGWDVDVFTRHDGEHDIGVTEWAPGVRVINVPAGPASFVAKEEMLQYMPEFADYTIDFIRTSPSPYRLVHANFFMSGWVGMQIKHALGLPLVMTFHALGKVRRIHQGDSDLFPASRIRIEEEIVRNADCIIAECPQDRSDLIALYGADPRQIETVPCGFDPGELGPMERAAARKALGWSEDRFTILQLGRMVPRKGVDNVIHALAQLRQQGTDACLHVVGGNSDDADVEITPEIGRLAAIAEALGVRQHVHFDGRRDRSALAQCYSAADVFVSTPWYEPFGITPLEAMACAIPVVGAAVGGIQHTVVDGKTGFLVPPKSPTALASRLALLARNTALRATMGAAGWARVHRTFTWAKVARQLGAIYSRHLANAARPSLPTLSALSPMAKAETEVAMGGVS